MVPLIPQKYVNTNNYNRNDFVILKKRIGIESKQVDILTSKNQALQILYVP